MVQIQRGFKTELAPNQAQRIGFAKAAGIARFAYNWGLERSNNIYYWNQLPHEPLKYESPIDQHKILNSLKEKEWPWMYEVSKCAPQEALRDLGNAFHNFLVRPDHFRWPKFKKKHSSRQSFTLTGGVQIKNDSIRLPSFGWVKLKEHGYLPIGRHALFAGVSSRAGRWFVSVGCRKRIKVQKVEGPISGVDWNVDADNWLVVSDEDKPIERPKKLKWYQRRLKRIQRSVFRKKKDSNNRRKAVLRLQKVWVEISNTKLDALHKATTRLATTKSVIVIEDLAPQNMAKNHSLASAVLDGAAEEMRRQLKYKTSWHGSRLIVAPRNYPSTKMCSRCGAINEIDLGARIYRCEACELTIGRHVNASKNLEAYGRKTVAHSSSGDVKRSTETGGRRYAIPVPVYEMRTIESRLGRTS
jgi:putative transposase